LPANSIKHCRKSRRNNNHKQLTIPTVGPSRILRMNPFKDRLHLPFSMKIVQLTVISTSVWYPNHTTTVSLKPKVSLKGILHKITELPMKMNIIRICSDSTLKSLEHLMNRNRW